MTVTEIPCAGYSVIAVVNRYCDVNWLAGIPSDYIRGELQVAVGHHECCAALRDVAAVDMHLPGFNGLCAALEGKGNAVEAVHGSLNVLDAATGMHRARCDGNAVWGDDCEVDFCASLVPVDREGDAMIALRD